MAQQPIQWRRLVTETSAIVLSILLAFAIDAGWSERQDRAEEQQLLVGLRAESQLNQRNLATTSASITAARELLIGFAADPSGTRPDIPGDSIRKAVIVSLARPMTSELVLGALEATIGSGKLDLIREPELRAALARLVTLNNDLAELRQIVTQLSLDGSLALTRHRELAAIIGAGLPLNLETAGTGAVVSPDTYSRILSDPAVVALAATKVQFWTGYLGETRSLVEQLRTVTRLIDAQVPKAS